MAIVDIDTQLARDEGDVPYPYLDCCGPNVPWRECPHGFKGHLTIGRGRNLDAKGISNKELLFVFSNDLSDVDEQLKIEYPWTDTLEDEIYGVLQNMCFNMGIRRLGSFKKMLGALRAGDTKEAARQLRDSNYWRGVTHNRAERLARQLELGAWQ